MSDPAAAQVPNPAIEWLQTLLTQVHSAQADIPLLDKPAGSIGPGPAWTGTRALKVHDQDLAPQSRAFRNALDALDGQVQSTLNDVRAHTPTVSSGTANMMRINRRHY